MTVQCPSSQRCDQGETRLHQVDIRGEEPQRQKGLFVHAVGSSGFHQHGCCLPKPREWRLAPKGEPWPDSRALCGVSRGAPSALHTGRPPQPWPAAPGCGRGRKRPSHPQQASRWFAAGACPALLKSQLFSVINSAQHTARFSVGSRRSQVSSLGSLKMEPLRAGPRRVQAMSRSSTPALTQAPSANSCQFEVPEKVFPGTSAPPSANTCHFLPHFLQKPQKAAAHEQNEQASSKPLPCSPSAWSALSRALVPKRAGDGSFTFAKCPSPQYPAWQRQRRPT